MNNVENNTTLDVVNVVSNVNKPRQRGPSGPQLNLTVESEIQSVSYSSGAIEDLNLTPRNEVGGINHMSSMNSPPHISFGNNDLVNNNNNSFTNRMVPLPPGYPNTTNSNNAMLSIGEFADQLELANNIAMALQSQVQSLQGDLLSKLREFEELRKMKSDSDETNNAIIASLRAELMATQQLLRQKDDELTRTQDVLKAENDGNNFKTDSNSGVTIADMHSLRNRLMTVEQDYKSSIAQNAELDQTRVLLMSELDNLRSQLLQLQQQNSFRNREESGNNNANNGQMRMQQKNGLINSNMGGQFNGLPDGLGSLGEMSPKNRYVPNNQGPPPNLNMNMSINRDRPYSPNNVNVAMMQQQQQQQQQNNRMFFNDETQDFRNTQQQQQQQLMMAQQSQNQSQLQYNSNRNVNQHVNTTLKPGAVMNNQPLQNNGQHHRQNRVTEDHNLGMVNGNGGVVNGTGSGPQIMAILKNPTKCSLLGCDKEGLYMCACQAVRYCGEAHQR